MLPPAVARKCALMLPYTRDVASRLRDILLAFCEEHGYAFTWREKDPESIAEKIESGRFPTWSAIDDCVACSIIIPTLAEEPNTVAFLTESFQRLELRGRGTTLKDPAVFRFDATRFIGKLRQQSLPAGAERLLSLPFEVQVRTAFEHAWSVTTHALVYKGSSVDWRRLRLAAQLKASVEQLDNLVAGFDSAAAAIAEQTWPEVVAKRSIENVFKTLFNEAGIPPEVAPRSWGRFSENLFALFLATTNDRVRDPVAFVKVYLRTLDTAIRALPKGTFPRSTSLLQTCIGLLVETGSLVGPLTRYTPLLTDELSTLYPSVAVLGRGFDFDA